MKYFISIFFVTYLFSCGKVNKDLLGMYHLEGIEVRCTYYECDTTQIERNIWFGRFNDNQDYAFYEYDSVTDEYQYLIGIYEAKNTPKELCLGTEEGTFKFCIDKATERMVYYTFANRYIYNNVAQARLDTSYYTILEGLKQ